ncbi:decarboxylase [Streptomyces alkaliphilus]|uniref:Decarboxylase n=1 Tax=Streptomyces alkaliphilus TaxID=1472722 RepID=A0A7W3TG30_9ACTN|nr:aspartate/glutamate racemase family protein [Streptomyces alkaliphilus]MBB0246151.1 decarboxylase [Streptomyces alkaliphilus]
MDVSFVGGPSRQRGVGIVAPFDFALDRELWRWVPDDVSLHLTRTPFVPVEVSLDLARLVSEHRTLSDAVQALSAVGPEVVAYACTSGSFVGGTFGERAMVAAMAQAGAMPAVTTSGALLLALEELGVRRIAVVTPYTKSVTDSLETYLGEGGITVSGRSYLGLTREIWRVGYRSVVDMAREATAETTPGPPEALFISCTNLPTFDVIPQLEAEFRMPVLSANQVTVWAALRRIGKDAVGPYQSLLDPVARRAVAAMRAAPPPMPPLPRPGETRPGPPQAAAAMAGPPIPSAAEEAAIGEPQVDSFFPEEPGGGPVPG